MRLCVSNIAWPSGKRAEILPLLKKAGVSALEIAPTKIWPDIFKVKPEDTMGFREGLDRIGLGVAGFHALLFGQGHMSIFGPPDIREQTLGYLHKLAQICSWVKGNSLVFGSPQCRRRGAMSEEESEDMAAVFFRELCLRCEGLGVTFVIEPLGENETDFITSAVSGLKLIKMVDHPGFMGHLDAKTLAESGEIKESVFQEYKPVLRHFHVNDPGLSVLDESDRIGHAELGRLLRKIEYNGYVSLEQRAAPHDPVEACLRSVKIMEKYYYA
ncbi:sugar phosphate isomerase/epimerase family protein [Candidatus Omnitrophota bacterium]